MEREITVLKEVWRRIGDAAVRSGRRADEVRLLAVSKGQPIEKMRALRRAGAMLFGENYVQEFLEKYEALRDDDIHWHFIGRLQTNKVKYLIDKVECIHSVDSIKLAEEIQKQAEKHRIAKMPILLQVNIGEEETKGGAAAEEVIALYRSVTAFDRIEVRGLMTLPPFLDPEEVRPYFRRLRELRDRIVREEKADTVLFRELSMGMSHDFEVAVEEGATIVRLGTLLFGPRG